jgi:5'(3')-deoxyribonucleotidase
MAKIGISINEVLRDFISQFIYTYNKYINETNIKTEEVTDFNLAKVFNFSSIDEFNKFLYFEAPLEIFGHADQLHDNLINHFNNFLMDLKDDGEHEIEVVSKEVGKSIPATFFFLSKTGCKIDRLRFVKKSEKEWDGLDILITADPEALKNKPE